jgi:type II secretory pathway component PulC
MQPDHDQVLIKPAVTVIQEPRVPELSSILIIGERRTAMFNNGDEKKVGDTIAGHIVKRIEPSYVILERAGKEHILKLPTVGELVITPAKEE